MSFAGLVERIKARVAAVDPNGPRTVLGVFQLHVTSPNGTQDLVVDLKALKVIEGTVESPDVTVTVTAENLALVVSKKLSYEEAIASKKVEYVGDKALAVALLTKLAE